MITLFIGLSIGAFIGFMIAAILSYGSNADEFKPKHLHNIRKSPAYFQ